MRIIAKRTLQRCEYEQRYYDLDGKQPMTQPLATALHQRLGVSESILSKSVKRRIQV